MSAISRHLSSTGRFFSLVLALYALLLPSITLAIPLDQLDLGASAVLDTQKILKQEEHESLENRLRKLHQQKLMQAAVLIIDSTEETPIFDYGMKIAEKWQLGEAGKDNGLLMLIAVKDRKFHTFTGSGLEGILTDFSLSRIQREALIPNFREQQYARGINMALDEMEKRLTADEHNLKKLLDEDREAIKGSLWGNVFVFILVAACIIFGLGLAFLIIWAFETVCHIPRYLTSPCAGLLIAALIWTEKSEPVWVTISAIVTALLYIPFARWATRMDQSSTPSSSGSRRRYSSDRGSSSRSSSSSASSSSSRSSYSGGGGRFSGGGSSGSW